MRIKDITPHISTILATLPAVYLFINAIILFCQGAPLTGIGALALCVGYLMFWLRQHEVMLWCGIVVMLTGVTGALIGEPESLTDRRDRQIDHAARALTALSQSGTDYGLLDDKVRMACSLAPSQDLGRAAVAAFKAIYYNMVLSAFDLFYQTWWGTSTPTPCRDAVEALVTTYPETRPYFFPKTGPAVGDQSQAEK